MQQSEMEKHAPDLLTNIEIDTIGEILNISMGAAATAISTLLERQVSITTPRVQCILADEFDYQELEPADGVEIEYIQGLHGYNFLIMKRRDVRTIVELLLGGDISGSEDELDEMHLSALSEIMNQMMGASSTALARFLGKSINISPPQRFDVGNIREKMRDPRYGGYIVTVGFVFKVEGMIDSEFSTVLPIDFTRELVQSVLGDSATEDMPGREAAGTESADAAPGGTEVPEPEDIPQYAGSEPDFGAAAAQAQPKSAQKVSVQPLRLVSFDAPPEPDYSQVANIERVLDVPLQITVEIGRTKKLIKEVLEFSEGSIVEIDKQAGDTVDVIVNGKLLARGDVVVIDDNFGVRITEIVAPKEIFKFL